MADIAGNMGEQVLQALGLDPVSVQVYLAMHANPGADAIQLAQQLGLQIPEVIDALDELSDLTLLRPGLTHSDRLRPVSIERALHTLLRQQSVQLTAQAEALQLLQSAMDELLATRSTRSDVLREVDVDALSGEEAIQTRIEALLVQAQESVCSMLPGGPIRKETLDAARQFDQETVERGVHVQALYQSAVRADRRTMDYLNWLTDLGTEIRTAPVLPMRIILIDDAIAVVGHAQKALPFEVFVIREIGVLAPIYEFFNLSWAAAEPLVVTNPGAAQDSPHPSTQELALLQLLASGSTDEASAKKLGVSVRTVRRIMADLMDRLGATSRFEAGHKATQRGWL